MTGNAPTPRSIARIGDAVVESIGQLASRIQEETPLRSDLLESPEELLLLFDAPGATVSDVEVWYEGGGIEVRVDRFRTGHEDFELTFPGRGVALEGRAELPEDVTVDVERASAELREDGTLEVRLPKDDDSDDAA